MKIVADTNIFLAVALEEPEKQEIIRLTSNAEIIAPEILPVSETVIDTAVILRRQKSMSLGNALIAGTALSFKGTLVTANVQDFIWIEDLRIINPIAENRVMGVFKTLQ